MRHFDLIENRNPSVIRGNGYVHGIVAAVRGLSREEANRMENFVVGDFITLNRDLCINGFGHLITNTSYPYIFKGIVMVEAPTPLEQEHHMVLTKGTTYILLNDCSGDLLVETDHAFSAV